MENNKAKLFQKIARIMGKVERVPKTGYNAFHKYHYVTESDLIDSVRKFMSEEGLIVFNNVTNYELNGEIATVTIEFTLACTETGESIKSVMIGQGQDKTDKAFYKAYAGAIKYFLMKTFLIPTGDDPEREDAQTGAPQSAPKQSNRQQGGNTPKWKIVLKKEDELEQAAGTTKTEIRKQLREAFGNLPKYKDMDDALAGRVLKKLEDWISKYSTPQ